jgi:hypothetical protein
LRRVPLERIEAPTALFERIVSWLIDGRRTLKDAGIEQDLGFAANDRVAGSDFIETGNGIGCEHGSLPAYREKGEDKIQRREQKHVIGKVFMKGKAVLAPQVQVGEGTDIDAQ